ncbi:uncharacterized protein LOC129594887 [Paramacrobiotus metropolitanus]|uniref:uncharacterized protein LOC129594887 n=1 Tax=Paramacrobiotus metropolitanus TaxID=2943436 RepID=UPI002445DB6B|nr:uncharacterized protein LOC129594887 [Paramacrobiotus metropolitanus]
MLMLWPLKKVAIVTLLAASCTGIFLYTVNSILRTEPDILADAGLTPGGTNRQLYSSLSSSQEERFDNDLHDYLDDAVFSSSDSLNRTVHFVKIYSSAPNKASNSSCWVECLSLLSVMLYINPEYVYLHTNYPDFWPFEPCQATITKWPKLRIVPVQRRFIMGGKVITFIEHQADMVKLYSVYKYGGIAMDFDVFLLPRLKDLLPTIQSKYECIVSKEYSYLNLGLIGCRKDSEYIAEILDKYVTDYRPSEWVYNSGRTPWKIYYTGKYQERVYVDDEISNKPDYDRRNVMLQQRGIINWMQKTGFHSYAHASPFSMCSLTELTLPAMKSSFADMLLFILNDGRLAGLVDRPVTTAPLMYKKTVLENLVF